MRPFRASEGSVFLKARAPGKNHICVADVLLKENVLDDEKVELLRKLRRQVPVGVDNAHLFADDVTSLLSLPSWNASTIS